MENNCTMLIDSCPMYDNEEYEYTKPNIVYAFQFSEFNSGNCKFIYFKYNDDCSDIAKAYGISSAMREDDFPYLDTRDVLRMMHDGHFIINEELGENPFGYDGSHYSIMIHDRICVERKEVVSLSDDISIDIDIYESEGGNFSSFDFEDNDVCSDLWWFVNSIERNNHGGFKRFANDDTSDRDIFDYPEIYQEIKLYTKNVVDDFKVCFTNNNIPFSFCDSNGKDYTISKRRVNSIKEFSEIYYGK